MAYSAYLVSLADAPLLVIVVSVRFFKYVAPFRKDRTLDMTAKRKRVPPFFATRASLVLRLAMWFFTTALQISPQAHWNRTSSTRTSGGKTVSCCLEKMKALCL